MTEYVEALRVFLGISKANFLRDAGFVDEPAAGRRGRLPRYKEEPIAALEEQVNAKSARCEAPDSTTGERLRLARDFAGLTDADIARHLDVSRELVRRWGVDMHKPSKMDELVELLDVPKVWLEEGGEEHLPAFSHLGVRVGAEAAFWRDQLRALTRSVIPEIPENEEFQYFQAYIEWTVLNRPAMALAARRAGGRWQVVEGVADVMFAPWVPIPEHGLSRRFWSDEVEAIIDEELVSQPSVYGAHRAMEERCIAMGLPKDKYPTRISLHKRVEKERLRAEKFGIDLNDQIAESVGRYETVQ
jgi:DNA-binding transcriptional regulator YiaG